MYRLSRRRARVTVKPYHAFIRVDLRVRLIFFSKIFSNKMFNRRTNTSKIVGANCPNLCPNGGRYPIQDPMRHLVELYFFSQPPDASQHASRCFNAQDSQTHFDACVVQHLDKFRSCCPDLNIANAGTCARQLATSLHNTTAAWHTTCYNVRAMKLASL